VTLKSLTTTVLLIVLAGLIAGAVLYARRQPFGSRPQTAGGPTEEEQANEPVVEVEQFSPEHFERGRPAWKVKLAHLAVETGGQTVTAGKMKEGLIYDPQGRPAVRVDQHQQAPLGQQEPQSNGAGPGHAAHAGQDHGRHRRAAV
jgi:hypothetical protein